MTNWHAAVAAARRWRGTALVILVVAVLGGWLGPRVVLGPKVPVSAVVQRDFVQSVVASGHVEAPHRVTIGTQVVGNVQRVPVSEGQSVVAGQVLLELERSELQAAAAQADMAVAQAEARLRQLREVQAPVAEQALREAELNRDNSRAQLRRNADLFGQGFIGQAALDDAQKAAALSEAQWRAAQSQLAAARSGGSDYAVAVAALAQARAGAGAAQSRLTYATVLAPVSGTLIDREVEPGDVVQPGKALMMLSPAGATQLVIAIDEKNLRLLAVGEPAEASADAYPAERFAATMAYINPGVDAQRGSVEVKLDVPRPPTYLRQDMTVSVEIRVATRPHAVLVPSDAVHDADSARPWVLKVASGRARRQDLRLGLHSGGLSEVLDGLKAGELVVPTSAAELGEGARLRPVVAPPF